MASKNLLEKACGVRLPAIHHWGPHPLVGFSSLCFAAPAVSFLAVAVCIHSEVPPPRSDSTVIQLILYSIICFLFTGVIVTSNLADFTYIKRGHRSYYGKFDIRLASATFFICIFDFALRASLLETCVLVALTVAAFVFSGLSCSFEQWVFRHIFWHVAAAGISTYGALRLPPEEALIASHILRFIAGAGAAYFAILVAVLVVGFHTPKEKRAALWDFGAAYAAWQPVEDETAPLLG